MESLRRESSRMSRQSFGSNKSSSPSMPSRGSFLSRTRNNLSQRNAKLGGVRSPLSGSPQTPQTESDGKFKAVGQSKEIKGFSDVFPVPTPGCQPDPPAKLKEDQQAKYDQMLKHFSQETEFPVSLKPNEKGREPLTDWEKMRLLSRESMLRYLRACKWDVQAAKRRLTETIAWRREFGVEKIKPEDVEVEARCGKETVLGYDSKARPVHYMHPHRSDTKESPRQMQYAVYILERCIDLMPPGVEQLALMINFEHKSRNPTSIANAKMMLYVLQNHYVENLGVNWSVNVPWVFKIFWNAIQPFIDPVTKSKCHFDDPVGDHVPAEQLSADFGGQLDAKYNHDSYWPKLIKLCAERREQMLRRFREDCKGEIGASEYVIRGGDDPTSPFNRAKDQDNVSMVATSTDQSSVMGTTTTATSVTVASANGVTAASSQKIEVEGLGLQDAEPLERFKTPSETLNEAPLDRHFSRMSVTNGVTDRIDEESNVSRSTTANTLTTQPASPTKEPSNHPKLDHTLRSASTMFKDLDKRLHASKLFAAFHPDSPRNSIDRPRTTSSAQAPTDDSTADVARQPTPSAHEVIAVAGAAGPTATAKAVGAIMVEKGRHGVQRIHVNASEGLSRLTTTGLASEDMDDDPAIRTITVLFFAAAKDAMGGKGKERLILPTDGTTALTLSALREHMLATFERDAPTDKYDGAALRKVMAQSKWSVDESMVDDDELDSTLIKGGEDVAIIPPVSGG